MSSIAFEPQPFAEGRFRTAHRGVYVSPLEKVGHKCVVKRKKSGFTWDPNGWDICIQIQEEAQLLAQGYVRYCQSQTIVRRAQPLSVVGINLPVVPFLGQQPPSAYKITFTKIDTCTVSHGPYQIPEYVIVEDYLSGSYRKWVNNLGGISSDSDVLPAFSHWSWVYTKGEKMIADLQGIHRDDICTYILTDPAILTASGGGVMGGADTGIVGMTMFFINHRCNQLCRDLPKPTWETIMQSIPNIQLQINPMQLLLMQLVNRNTVFVHELDKLDPGIKAALIHLFKQIVQGN